MLLTGELTGEITIIFEVMANRSSDMRIGAKD
jgi:hypothetical protein